jgi:hypothetical protein
MSTAGENRQLIMDYFDAWARGDVKAGESYWADDLVTFQAGHSAFAGEFHGPKDLHARWVEPLLKLTGGRWTVKGKPEVILSGDDGVVVIADEFMVRDGKGRRLYNSRQQDHELSDVRRRSGRHRRLLVLTPPTCN